MSSLSRLHLLALASIIATLAASFFAQTAPVFAPDKAREQKAREYLQLAQDSIAQSANKAIPENVRYATCLLQASIGDFATAQKSAAALSSGKLGSQIAVARIRARTDKTGAIEYLHTLGSTWTSSPDDLAYLATAQANLGDIEGALQLAAAMKPTLHEDPAVRKAELLDAIAIAQAQAGDLPAAIKTFASAKAALDTSTNPASRPQTLRQIASAQMQAGDAGGARQTADEITSPDQKLAALRMLAFFAAKSDKAAARALLDESRNLAAQSEASNLIEQTFLARAYASLGDAATAKILLTEARAAAEMQESQTGRAQALAVVAQAQRITGDAAAATDTMGAAMAALEQLNDAGERLRVLWMIARQQADAGDVEGTRQSLGLVMKGRIDPTKTTDQAAAIAFSLAHAVGPNADLSWIAQLPTPEEKAVAYAAAAAGLLTELTPQ